MLIDSLDGLRTGFEPGKFSTLRKQRSTHLSHELALRDSESTVLFYKDNVDKTQEGTSHYLPKVVLTIIKNRNIVLTTDVNRTISNFSSKNCFEEINGLNRKCNILTHRLTYHL